MSHHLKRCGIREARIGDQLDSVEHSKSTVVSLRATTACPMHVVKRGGARRTAVEVCVGRDAKVHTICFGKASTSTQRVVVNYGRDKGEQVRAVECSSSDAFEMVSMLNSRKVSPVS